VIHLSNRVLIVSRDSSQLVEEVSNACGYNGVGLRLVIPVSYRPITVTQKEIAIQVRADKYRLPFDATKALSRVSSLLYESGTQQLKYVRHIESYGTALSF
jgi:hypothetical protein